MVQVELDLHAEHTRNHEDLARGKVDALLQRKIIQAVHGRALMPAEISCGIIADGYDPP